MTDSTLQTQFGIFSGITASEYTPDGKLESITLEERNLILTHAGELIPFYGEETVRRKRKPSVTFHRNGMIKAVALEEQTEVQSPIGELPAELIVFYDSGEVKRVFPLDGKLSGFWSEADERALNIPLTFHFDFTAFQAMLSGIAFYKSGQIKSVTLYPDERIVISAGDCGAIPVRQGFSVYESGALESLEPAVPTTVQTPVGVLTAYDIAAHGINADTNSLGLDKSGRVMHIATSADRIAVHRTGDTELHSFAPAVTDDEDGAVTVAEPLRVSFDYDGRLVSILTQDGSRSFSFDDEFFILAGRLESGGCSGGDCSSCSLCASRAD